MTTASDNFTTLLDNIVQGAVMFDSSRCLVVWNKQYEDFMRFPDGFLRVGIPHQEMIFWYAEQGKFGEGDPEDHTNRRLDLF